MKYILLPWFYWFATGIWKEMGPASLVLDIIAIIIVMLILDLTTEWMTWEEFPIRPRESIVFLIKKSLFALYCPQIFLIYLFFRVIPSMIFCLIKNEEWRIYSYREVITLSRGKSIDPPRPSDIFGAR